MLGFARGLSFTVLLLSLFECGNAASAMLVGGVGTPSGGEMMMSQWGGHDNASVSFDSVDSMSRLHGSGLKVQVDLLEIVTAKGVFRTSPTHTEFAQNDGSRWAQLYSGDEMTVYYNDEAVLQLAGGGSSDSSLTVNGIGYFTDVAIDKQNAKLIGMAICRVKNALSSNGQQSPCDASKFFTMSEMLVAMVQSQVDVVEMASASGGTASSNGGDKKPNNVNQKEVGAQIKMSLENFERQLLSSRPLKNSIHSHTEEMQNSIKDIRKTATKNEDIMMKMQSALGELSGTSGKLDKEIKKVESRLQKSESAASENAWKDDMDRLRGTVIEMDQKHTESIKESSKLIQSTENTLKSVIAEADTRTSLALTDLSKQAYLNVTAARSNINEEMKSLHNTINGNLSTLQAGVKNVETKLSETDMTAAGLEKGITHLNSSMMNRLDTLAEAMDTKISMVNDQTKESVSILASNTTTITNDISSAVAKSNGILSKAIGDMNATLQATDTEIDSIKQNLSDNFIQRSDYIVTLEAIHANLTAATTFLQKHQDDAIETNKAFIRNVNASTRDWAAVTEARLVHGMEEISSEVSVVETTVKVTLDKARAEIREDFIKSNISIAAALDITLSKMDKEIGGLQASVSVQLGDIGKNLASVSESSSIAREVLNERLTSLTARVSREEEITTLAVETSAQNREKLSKMSTLLESCEKRHSGTLEEVAKMRDRLTKLETLVEVLMKR